MNGILFIFYLIFYLMIASLLDSSSNIRIVAMNIFNCSMCYIFVMLSTYWVIKQYNNQLFEMNSKRTDLQLSLEQILSTYDGFDLFANHLVNEFNTENLYFIFEVVQIKHQAIKNKLIDEESVGVMIEMESGLMDKMRRNDGEIKNINDLEISLKYIMNEYIKSYSSHCVNISGYTRNIILAEFEKMEMGLVYTPNAA